VAHVTGDRVKDTTTTTGTGNITVSGTAPTGFRTLSTVATADGDTLFLAIVGGAEWETSLATRVSANVYTRTTILESSNANAAVNFAAGTKDVFITKAASESTWLIGGADRAAPTAQTWTTQNVATGTSNTNATDLTWNLASPTGTGNAGNLIIASAFKSPTPAATTVTMTIATPGVVTHTAHGFVTGQPVVFTTTGALPTGITASTTYYVISVAGSTTTYRVATSVANAIAGTAINTTGSQSGTHTCTTLATVQNPDITAITVGPSGLTGSQTTPLVDLRQTWNSSGAAIMQRYSVTQVSSAEGSFFTGVYNGTTVLRAWANSGGRFTAGSAEFDNGYFSFFVTTASAQSRDTTQRVILIDTASSAANRTPKINLQSGGSIGWSANGTGSDVGVGTDLFLGRDAAATLAIRNTTTAQAARIYRTWTDASNYERLALQSGSGYFEVAAETAGTGTDDLDVRLTPAGTGKTTSAASITARSGTAIPAGGTAGAGVMVSSTANFGMFFGSGAPTLSAAKGSLYLRSDGSGTGDRAYINTDGGTTWTALTTAA
jgi:hypothetical protein